MWAGIAPALAERFTLVIPDLRGYGRSSKPENDPHNHAYSKRQMGRDMVAVMAALGHESFAVAGHDRGGRVAYRMALDHPETISRLAVLDIVPVADVWERMDAGAAMKTYHWPFLAQPFPLPERLVAADPIYYLEHTIKSWTKAGSLSAFAPAALDEYRQSFGQPENVHGACNDYRAGATIDWQLDREDRAAGHKIAPPVLALWGDAGVPSSGTAPLDLWRPWCVTVEGAALPSGHFVVEEAPEETQAALLEFFSR